MSLLEIRIKDDGSHWYKEIRLFGLLVYHRHDYTTNKTSNSQIGFNSGQYCPGEIEGD